jgi:hypothetical protein
MALDSLDTTCDATASGTETAYYTWLLERADDQPMQLNLCAHHSAEKAAALKLAGFSQYRREALPV